MELDAGVRGEARARALLAGSYVLIGAALGVVLGFWAADFGARFLPHTLAASLGLLLLACAAAGTGLWLSAGRFDRRVGSAASVFFAATLALGAVFLVHRPSELTGLPEIELRRAQELDARYYRDLDRTLQGLVARFRGSLDATGAGAGPGSNALSTEEDEQLALDTWNSYLDTAVALDRVRNFHEDFYRFDLSRVERSAHIRSFLLSFACELSLYENTTRLIESIRSRPSLTRFLNLARPERGVPVDSVAYVDEELTGLTDLTRVSAGRRYLSYLETFHDGRSVVLGDGLEWLWDDVERYVSVVEARSTRRAVAASASSDFAPILRGFRHISFPLQREVAEWMGDTRLKRTGSYLIPAELAREAERELSPGDVLLARKNWYLSNVGLPGFWPHAILYAGTPEAIARAFDDDPEVLAWVQVSTGRPIRFTDWLAEAYPLAWSQKLRAAGSEEALTLIEAVSEGVVQSALVHSSGDFLVALRPRVSPLVRARALFRAFAFLDRPYDFDFDFATDDALVCTEVVWRAYRPGAREDTEGLRLEPVTIAGRSTLPANELARLFVTEREREDRQLDFVFYLEGDETLGTAARGDAAVFEETVERSKWGG